MALSPLASRAPALSPHERLSDKVAHVTRAWMRIGREEARRLGLTLPQLILLRSLREMGQVPVSRFVGEFGATPSSATGLLDGLEGAGLLRRTRDKVDRRQVLVSLTPKGIRVSDRLKEGFRARWAGYCSDVPGPRLDAAAAVLEVIAARMDRPSPPAHAPPSHPTHRTRSP